MKKFKFSFQYLLDTHRSRAEAAEHALHEAMRIKAGVQDALDKKRMYEEDQKRILEQMVGVVARVDFANYRRSIELIQREMAGLNAELRRCEEKVEFYRKVFRQEMTDQRIMENLCERERAEWATAILKEEQKQMDEVAVTRWTRQEKIL